MNLSQYKKIHLIGIGGIGMSALAKYLRHNNIQVTGSDLAKSAITDDLSQKYEIPIYIGVHAENVTEEHDAIIYSPAIAINNIERQEARYYNIPEFSYPEVLGYISTSMKTIAVSGTNGKTTTTTMVIELLKHLELDPTGIVGALLQKYNSNFIAGQSEYFVTESCEYKESFLHIHHDILVITNITEDHLDYFKNLSHIQETFKKFLLNKKQQGILICNTNLPELQPVVMEANKIGMVIIPYQKYLKEKITLTIPGKHNIQNAAAALAVLEALDLSISEGKKYLEKFFLGAKRRMEHIGLTKNNALLFDDYAHNPEGLQHLISGLRDFYPEKKIILLFEPHLYSRTRDFKNEFARILESVDILYLFPTYRAREPEILQENYLLEQYIDTTKVELHTVSDTENFARDFLNMNFGSEYLVVTVGAGDIWKQGLRIKK